MNDDKEYAEILNGAGPLKMEKHIDCDHCKVNLHSKLGFASCAVFRTKDDKESWFWPNTETCCEKFQSRLASI